MGGQTRPAAPADNRGASARPDRPGGGERLTLLTLNLWNVNPPVDERLDRLVGALRGRRPDLLALQEVSAVDGVNQAERIAVGAGFRSCHYSQAWSTPIREEGLALLSDLPISALPDVRLPDVPEEAARILQHAELSLPSGAVVRVANTHLSWRVDASVTRTAQAEWIRAELLAWDGPLVLVGDLNDTADSEPLRVLLDADTHWRGLVDCYGALHTDDGWTFDRRNPWTWQVQLMDRRIDHILASHHFDVLHAAVVFTGEDAPVVSDHYGVQATLGL